MTDHFLEENGVRYVAHIAHPDGTVLAYYVRFNGQLVRCYEDPEGKE